MNWFTGSNGHRLYFESVASGLPVLLLHAGVADSRMWNHQFADISGFQLVRFDFRGYGKSPLGSRPFTNHQDVVALLDHLGLEQAILVGCSVGGNTALQVVEHAPERVMGLVLIGADAPGFEADIEYESPEWSDVVQAWRDGDLQRAAELEAEIWLAGVGRSTDQIDPDTVRLFVEMDLVALGSETRRNELDASHPLISLPAMHAPTMIVVGERDIPQMHAAAAYLSEQLGEGMPTVIPNAAHLPSMDQPSHFNDHLIRFLGRL